MCWYDLAKHLEAPSWPLKPFLYIISAVFDDEAVRMWEVIDGFAFCMRWRIENVEARRLIGPEGEA